MYGNVANHYLLGENHWPWRPWAWDGWGCHVWWLKPGGSQLPPWCREISKSHATILGSTSRWSLPWLVPTMVMALTTRDLESPRGFGQCQSITTSEKKHAMSTVSPYHGPLVTGAMHGTPLRGRGLIPASPGWAETPEPRLEPDESWEKLGQAVVNHG